jgi:hypothetical protein
VNTADVGSTAEGILLAAQTIDWGRYGVHDPAEIIDALACLMRAPSPADVQAAHDILFDVLVHNHSGEVRDAAVPAAPLLARVAELNVGPARSAALDLLCDLLRWSRPDRAGSEKIHDVIRSAVRDLTPLLHQLSAGRLNKTIPTVANELLGLLNEDAGHSAEVQP